jgi:hypothetical protein
MLIIGKTDAFEQNYMAKFEQLATDHGVFVKYERDRAARDIGLHLTKDLSSGQKQVTNSLVWFQMKGVMATTLTLEAYEAAGSVSLSMDVEHLRHWFLDNEPTHLIVYVEAAEQFLVTNLQNYVSATWGRGILSLDQKTATVTVPKTSVLDDQAFSILLRYADIAQWVKALDAEQGDIELVHRDCNLIYAIGTAEKRGAEHRVQWIKWLSKMRHEFHVQEKFTISNGKSGSEWETIHEHWQYGGIDPENAYPYVELSRLEEDESEYFIGFWDDEEDGETIVLRNGDEVFGPNACNEYCEFTFGARLNEYGKKLFEYVEKLVNMGLLELRKPDSEERTFLSIAPWHSRLV